MNRKRFSTTSTSILQQNVLSNSDILGYFAAQETENQNFQNEFQFIHRSINHLLQSVQLLTKNQSEANARKKVHIRREIQTESNQNAEPMEVINKFKEGLTILYNTDRLVSIASLHYTALGILRFVSFQRYLSL